MRITYARVWMRLIRIESELAGFAFNALLNSHSCRQALKLAEACQCFIKALKPLLSLASTAS